MRCLWQNSSRCQMDAGVVNGSLAEMCILVFKGHKEKYNCFPRKITLIKVFHVPKHNLTLGYHKI